MSTDLRYPVGRFSKPEQTTEAERTQFIDTIAETPGCLKAAVDGLTRAQIDSPYRPGGWTVRQVVHHLADSHINSYVRFRLALTEEEPTIKTYDESQWAELADARAASIASSLLLLENLHIRWELLLRGLSTNDWGRAFRHPELGLMRLDQNLALYAWHGRHHIAHITSLRKRSGWV